MGFKYKIVEKNDELKLATIQKSGIKHEFTLQTVYEHMAQLDKSKKEIQAMADFKKKVIEAFKKTGTFDFLDKEFTKAEVEQLARYFHDLDSTFTADEKLAEINQQIKEYEEEVADILNQIDAKDKTDKKDTK